MAAYVRKYVVEQLVFCPPCPPSYDTVEDIVVSNSTHILHINPGKCLSDEGRNVVIVFSHGNGDDLGTVRKQLESFAQHWNVEIVSYDYTGYGPFQTETPSEKECYKNLNDVIEYLAVEGIDKEKIVLMGRSLGSGPTCHAASCGNYKAVVLISPLLSAVKVRLPLTVSSIDIFENFKKIHLIHCPLMIVHGEIDKVVPYSHGIDLFELAPNKYKFMSVEEACHNDLLMGTGRFSSFIFNVAEFLDSLENE